MSSVYDVSNDFSFNDGRKEEKEMNSDRRDVRLPGIIKRNFDVGGRENLKEKQKINVPVIYKPIGLAVICVHGRFPKSTLDSQMDRPAAYEDARMMAETWNDHGCHILQFLDHNTLFYDENLIERISSQLDIMGNLKLFVFVLSSHGQEIEDVKIGDEKRKRHIFATKDSYYDTQNLIDRIAEIPKFYDIPKLFLIQACRTRASERENKSEDRGHQMKIRKEGGHNVRYKTGTENFKKSSVTRSKFNYGRDVGYAIRSSSPEDDDYIPSPKHECCIPLQSDNDSFPLPADDDAIPLPDEDDTIHLPAEDNTINLAAEDDTIHLAEEDDTIHLAEEDDTIHLTEEDDTIHLAEEDDTIHLAEEDDTIHLAEEDDTIHLAEEDDTIYLAEEDDTIHLAEKDYTIHLAEEDDSIPPTVEMPLIETVPHCDECIVMFSSMSGKDAYRTEKNRGGKLAYIKKITGYEGGWLIKALYDAISDDKFHQQKPIFILDLLTEVNRKVGIRTATADRDILNFQILEKETVSKDLLCLLLEHIGNLREVTDMPSNTSKMQDCRVEIDSVAQKLKVWSADSSHDLLIIRSELKVLTEKIVFKNKCGIPAVSLKSQSCFCHNLAFEDDKLYLKKGKVVKR